MEKMSPYKWVMILFSGTIIGLLILATTWANSMKTERFLELHIQSDNIVYYVKYNNVKVFSEVQSSPITQVIPVNQWTYNGKNLIFVSANFESGNDTEQLEKAGNSKLKISLVLREKRDGENHNYTITTFDLTPSSIYPDKIASSSVADISLGSNNNYQTSDNGDIAVGEWLQVKEDTWIDFSQEVDIDISLPKWAYIDSDDLGNDQTMSDDEYYGMIDDLYKEYQKIWLLMKDKNKDELLQVISQRAGEYEAAFYLEPGSKLSEMERSLVSAFEHEDLSLSDMLEKDYLRLIIEANGKVANLKPNSVSEPIIYYSHVRGSFTRFYDFYFMKKDGKWIIIR